MKTIKFNSILSFAIFIHMLSVSNRCIAQFIGSFATGYGRFSELSATTPLQESVGIGDFLLSANNLPLARLHVASFRMGSSSDNLTDPFSEGILFRTDGDQSLANSWHLYTGSSATSQIERFRLYTDPGNTPDIGLRTYSGGFRFETNENIRMRVNGNSSAIINGFSINNSGFIAISNNQMFWNDSGSPKTPFSLLHLAGGSVNYQQTGYRGWMTDGITFTTNNDLEFIGPRSVGTDVTEFVIGWTDNSSSSFGPDDLVFRFLSGNGQSPTGANSLLGTQIIRCIGANDGRVGIGTQFDITNDLRPQRKLDVHDGGTNNLLNAQLRLSHTLSETNPICADFRVTSNGNLFLNCYGSQQRFGIEEAAPLERLDINGNLRIQEVPQELSSCILLGSQLSASTPEDIRLSRLDFNNNTSTYFSGNGTWQILPNTICDWNLAGTNDLSTGHPGACRIGDVFIGSAAPGNTSKLWVSNESDQILNTKIGVSARISASTFSWGMRSTAFGGSSQNIAVEGLVTTGQPGSINIGVKGESLISSPTSYAVYGNTNNSTAWAGYFNGKLYANSIVTPSDLNLKTNINSLNSGLDLLRNISVYTYQFSNEYASNVSLDSQMHFGVLSQELNEILPSLVSEVQTPSQFDENGNVFSTSNTILAVNYIEIIPILIAATQEMELKIIELEEKLNECCNKNLIPQDQSNPILNQESPEAGGLSFLILGQNQPNPFSEQTLIPYNLPENSNYAELLFFNNEGKLIDTRKLTEKQGTVAVLGSNLSNGTYMYTLVIDGVPVTTKKMIKN